MNRIASHYQPSQARTLSLPEHRFALDDLRQEHRRELAELEVRNLESIAFAWKFGVGVGLVIGFVLGVAI